MYLRKNKGAVPIGHSHGGNREETARIHKIDVASIIDFSANINPLGISPKAKEAIIKAVHSIENYPDTESYEFVKALAVYHHMAPENIVAGNGSIEFIYLIPKVLKSKRALIVAPAFSEYERALYQADCHVEYFPLKEEDDFILTLPSFISRLKDGFDTVWIGNPGNPTGKIISKNDIKMIIDKAEAGGVSCIVDEAFIDFKESESVKAEVKRYKNLIVLQSMTKFFALAGLRVGYAFGGKNFIKEMKKWKEPWTLNRLGEAAAVASLKDRSYRKKTLDFINAERTFLYDRLHSLPFLKTYPASANYILVKLNNGIRSNDMQERLLNKDGILVRDCGNYHCLDGEFLRLAVRKRGDNILLIEALKRASKG